MNVEILHVKKLHFPDKTYYGETCDLNSDGSFEYDVLFFQ